MTLLQRSGMLVVLLIGCHALRAETVAYWEFDRFADGRTPASIGGLAMDLASEGAGSDFRGNVSAACDAIPNPDASAAFTGNAQANAGSLRSPGNPILNRYLTTRAGTNVLRLHERAWTLEGWVRCTGDEPDGFGDVLVTTRDEPQWCGVTLMVNPGVRPGDGRRLAAYFEVKAHEDGDTASIFSLRTDGLLTPDRWYHIAMTWEGRSDQTARARLFVNGVVESRIDAHGHIILMRPNSAKSAYADQWR